MTATKMSTPGPFPNQFLSLSRVVAPLQKGRPYSSVDQNRLIFSIRMWQRSALRYTCQRVEGGGKGGTDMRFKVRCENCGAEFWLHGEVDPETNGVHLGDEVIEGDGCHCGTELTVV